MGSNFFGELNLKSGSSRKSKKSNSDKQKQPQRGLGVAQLEKIRLGINYYPGVVPFPTSLDQDDARVQKSYLSMPSSEISYPSSSLAAPCVFHPGFLLMEEHERINRRYFDQHYSLYNPSRYPSKDIVEFQHSSQSNITRPFLNIHHTEMKQISKTNHGNNSSSKDSKKFRNEKDDIDLELRLSI